MPRTTLERLDDLLLRSDSDSQDWGDGLGWELAGELLAQLTEQEWPALQGLIGERSGNWRACLASVLRPQLGSSAARLLLDLSADRELEVAFLALRSVAFYCGVIDSAKGPHLNPAVMVPSFLLAARAASDLAENIRTVSAQCHPRFQRQFDLLLEELAPGA